jgi:hypothetical protein
MRTENKSLQIQKFLLSLHRDFIRDKTDNVLINTNICKKMNGKIKPCCSLKIHKHYGSDGALL